MKGLLVLSRATALLACKSPTEPTETCLFSAFGTFGTVDGSATILPCRHVLDGGEVLGAPFRETPDAQVRVSPVMSGVARGHHQLELRVTAQPSSATLNRASGITVELLGGGWNRTKVVSRVSLPDQSASLASGESLAIAFDL